MQGLSSAVGLRRRSLGARADPLPASGIEEAVWGLAVRTPQHSAVRGLWRWQKTALTGLAAAIGSGGALAPEATLAVLFAVMAVPFLFVVALRCAALWHLFAHPVRAPEQPPFASMRMMPLYTVLVPLYREACVVPQLLGALLALDYPKHRLEIILVVESVDTETSRCWRR